MSVKSFGKILGEVFGLCKLGIQMKENMNKSKRKGMEKRYGNDIQMVWL